MDFLPTNVWQLIVAVVLLLVGAFAREIRELYGRYRDSKDKEIEEKKELEAERLKVKQTETEKVFDAYEDIVKEYARLVANTKSLEAENSQLRPLILRVALLQQEIQQCREDKEDWKFYADRLSKQLEGLQQVPLPFRRTPRDGDTGERIKTISRKMRAVQEELKLNSSIDATIDAPTIVQPSNLEEKE